MEKKSKYILKRGAAFLLATAITLGVGGCSKKEEEEPTEPSISYEDDLNPSLEPSKPEDTNKPKEPEVKPEPPQVNQPLEPETHNHEYGAWEALNDKEEIQTCSCGATKTRTHNYEEEILELPSYEDDTLTAIIKKVCSTCHHEILVSSSNIELTFTDWTYNPETKQDERKCHELDYIETRPHTHQFGEWENFNNAQEIRQCVCEEIETREHLYKEISNKIPDYENGTYKIITTKVCENCGNELIILEESKKLTFTDWTYNPKTNEDERRCLEFNYIETKEHNHNYNLLKSYNENGETKACVCGKTTEIPHNLEEIVGQDGSITYKCTNPECDYKNTLKHTHDYTKLQNYDDNYEYWACSCGQLNKVMHKLSPGSPRSDGSIVYSCENKGCNYEKIVKPTHTHSFVITNFDADYEYLECSCGITKKASHNLKSTLNADGSTTYECINPGCGYQKTTEPPHVHKFNIFEKYDDNYEYWACSCNETTTIPHSLDSGTRNPDDYSMTYKCIHPECGYQKTEYHTHNWQVQSYNETQETLSCECGKTTNRAHNLETLLSAEGAITYKCTNDGCAYERVQTHVHTLRDNREIIGTAEICETVTNACKDCGWVNIKYNTTHNFMVYKNEEICMTCGYSRPLVNSEPEEKPQQINYLPDENKPVMLVLTKKNERGMK